MPGRARVFAAAAIALSALAGSAFAGPSRAEDLAPAMSPIPQEVVGFDLDTGALRNLGAERSVVFTGEVRRPGAAWIRLSFDEAALAPGAFIRVTSLKDGYWQFLDAFALEAWQNTSAYFNGDTLKVEVVAEPGPGASRVVIREIVAGLEAGPQDSICGPTDDRVRSFDNRQGRAMPIGCTAWLVNDCAKCFISAGHCATSNLQVIQFNVPLSLPGGTIQNPPPEDQYPVDILSRQSVNGGIGNDWAYFGVFANTQTGMTPWVRYGRQAYTLAAVPPAVNGQNIRITGYGTSSLQNGQLNQVQTTHAGPYVSFTGSTLRYRPDTTGGNSGSAVVDESTGLAIGVHTHAGCTSTGGSNQGTAINLAAFVTARNNPRGVCLNRQVFGDTNGDGLVDFFDLNTVLNQFGSIVPGLAGDVDGDGDVDFADLNIVLNQFGRNC